MFLETTIVLSFFIISCNQVPKAHFQVSISDPLLIKKDKLYFYNQQALVGTIVSDQKEQSIKTAIQVSNGKLHGSYQEWFEDGSPKTVKHFKHGKEDGLQRGYHHNGNISYNFQAYGGIREGLYEEFFPNGHLQIEKTYEKGQAVKTKILSINGKTIANYVVKEGRTYGPTGSQDCISVINAKG